MIRADAIPYIAAAAVLAVVTVAAFLEPLTPQLRRELDQARDGARQMPALVRATLSTVLVAIVAASERRATVSPNGSATAGERAALEASIGQELDREARQP